MYPAQQWYNDHPHSNARPPPPQHRGRRGPPRRRASMPLMMGPVGPRLGLLGMLGMFAAGSAVNAAVNNNNRPPPRYNRTQSQANYPASSYNPNANTHSQSQPVIIDILKQGFLEIEYKFLVKIYRKKWFILKSDSKLYYYDSPQAIYNKPDGIIDLEQVISLKKINSDDDKEYFFEMEISNKAEAGNVDIKKLLTPDTSQWKLRCQTKNDRNDWFDCIRCFVSQNKNPVYIEREVSKKQDNKDMEEKKDDDWCVVDKKEDQSWISKILSVKDVHDDELNLDETEPEQPGMNVNNDNSGPPAYNPEYAQDVQEEEEGNDILYGDEGRRQTFQ